MCQNEAMSDENEAMPGGPDVPDAPDVTYGVDVAVAAGLPIGVVILKNSKGTSKITMLQEYSQEY
jgi:hypothetical protein